MVHPQSTDDDKGLAWLLWPWRLAASGLAPQTLTQPINPGWSFGNVINVTSSNSSSPDTEREIVSRHSYGRQIGRMMDAIELLLEERGPKAAKDRRADEFRDLRRQVETIKLAAARRRLASLRADLAAIKRADPAEHARLSAELSDLLGDG